MADGTITGVFGWDNGPLIAGMKQAEKQGATTAAKIVSELKTVDAATKQTGVNWSQLARDRIGAFNQTSGRSFRTAANFGPAPAGKYPSPSGPSPGASAAGGGGPSLRSQVGVARMFRSLLAIGGITEVANALINKAEEEVKQRAEVAKLTASTGTAGGRTDSDIRGNLSGSIAEIAKIRDDQLSGQMNFLRRAEQWGGDLLSGSGKKEREEETGALRKRASQDISDLASKQDLLNQAQEETVSGSERQAKLLEEEAKWRERIGALAAAEAAAGVNNPAARNAENQRHQQAREQINRESATAQREAQMKLEDLKDANVGSGLTPAAAKMQSLRRSLAETRYKESQPYTTEQVAGLNAQEIGTGNEMDALRLAGSRTSSSDRMQVQRKADKDKRDLARLHGNKNLLSVHRDMSGQVIGGVDPITGKPVDLSPSFNSLFHPNGSMDNGSSASRNNTSLTQKQFDNQKKNADKNGPLTKADMESIMAKFWGGR